MCKERLLPLAILLMLTANATFAQEIHLIDPNFKEKGYATLNYTGKLTRYPHSWAKFVDQHVLVPTPGTRGLVADGVSPVIIVMTAPEKGCVEFLVWDDMGSLDEEDVGRLRDPFAPENVFSNPLKVDTRVTDPNGIHYAVAVLYAPVNFARGQSDWDKPTRGLVIEATFFKEQYCLTEEYPVERFDSLDLHRPPVLLTHGLWSSGATWDWPEFLESNNPEGTEGLFFVKNTDYESTNSDHFQDNANVIPDAIQDQLAEIRGKRIAVTQVDHIGHSMGGILARRFADEGQVSGVEYERRENWKAGDFHKMITLDTPHNGSLGANKLIEWTHFPAQGILFKIAMAAARRALGGAVEDLQWPPCGHFGKTYEVPSHAMCGTGGSTFTALVDYVNEIVKQAPVYKSFKDKIPGIPDPADLAAWLDSVYEGDLHDLVVPLTSQLGGLSGASTTVAGTPAHEMIHFKIGGVARETLGRIGVTASLIMQEHALTLLNARVDSPKFAPGFPLSVDCLSAPSGPGPGQITPLPVPFAGIDIINPATRASIEAGQMLTVQVQTKNGFDPFAVMASTPHGGASVDGAASMDISISIPSEIAGPLRINVLGFDDAGRYAESHVIVTVVPPGSVNLTGLDAPPSLALTAIEPAERIRVRGAYDDGFSRELGYASQGTTYTIADPTIVAVDADGVVSGLMVGDTTVTVMNGGFSKDVMVDVLTIKGDRDADGDVDLDDFGGLAYCITGGYGGNAPLTREHYYIYDFDLDDDLDQDDVDAFFQVYTGPLGSDCNANGIDDINDILDGTSYDLDEDGVPDECGVDCNSNGLADSWEITPRGFFIGNPVEVMQFGRGADLTEITSADFDLDGMTDLAIIDSGVVKVLLAAEGFTTPIELSISGTASRLLATDLDGDALPDLAVTAGSDVHVLRNDGNGVFTETATVSASSTLWGIAAADLDNDGDVDLVVSRFIQAEVTVLRNNGTGGFTAAGDFSTDLGPTRLVAADLNGDSHPEVAVVCSSANSVSVLHNKADGTIDFWPAVHTPTGQYPRSLDVADLTGDGVLDLAVANTGEGTVSILQNTGAGYFAVHADYTTDVYPMSVSTGDLDGDGRAEVLAADWRNAQADYPSVALITTQANAFTAFPPVPASMPAIALDLDLPPTIGPLDQTIGDFDGNGTLDIAVVSGLAGNIMLFLNEVEPLFGTDANGNDVPDDCE